jgi:DNA (cytosine-5)-methyltransferase 1
MVKKPKVIDLFSGAGFLSYAFKSEGYCIIQAVEKDVIAASTYRTNMGNHIQVADIKRAEPIGKCDVLIGGPPCQGFSTLGKRDPKDERNFLSLEIVRWAIKSQPKVIVIENVEAFLYSPVWIRLASKLKRLGYDVSSHVLNAFDLGVPQIRKRSFTIASKIGLPEIKNIYKKPVRTVRQAWTGLAPEPNGHNFHYSPEPSALAIGRMKVIPQGGNKLDVLRSAPELAAKSWWSLGKQVGDAWGRMIWDKPSNTLRTCLQNPSKGRYLHPEQHRVISLREAARIQTIPDSWYFEGTPTQIARQIGNGVPILLGRAVARSVKELL